MMQVSKTTLKDLLPGSVMPLIQKYFERDYVDEFE